MSVDMAALIDLRLWIATDYTSFDVILLAILIDKVVPQLILLRHGVSLVIYHLVEGVDMMHLHVVGLAKLVGETDVPVFDLLVLDGFLARTIVTIRW